MSKHFFLTSSKRELKKLKEEYLKTSFSFFTKKYHISNNDVIKLFGKKGMKGIVWKACKKEYKRPIEYKKIIKENKIKTNNKFNCDFFNKWLYKNNIDNYYIKLYNNK